MRAKYTVGSELSKADYKVKVLIHGVPNTGYMWQPLITALDLGKNDFLTPTMPCFDGHTPDGFTSTVNEYVDWLVRYLEIIFEQHGPIDLVGHDWGAPLSAMAAQARPELIKTWSIINAAPEPEYEWHSIAKAWQTPVIGEIFMAMANSEKFHQKLTQEGVPKAIADHEAPLIDKHMKRAILRLYRSGREPSEWTMDFSNIADRGLVLWAGADLFVPVKVAKRFCARWGIPLEIADDLGHWGICADPKAFAPHLSKHWNNERA